MPSRGLPLGRVAEVAIRAPSLRSAAEPGLTGCTYFHPETVTWGFGTHAAAVEVDLETCDTRVLSYVAVHDCGRPINPVIVEGQLHGGVVQGIGSALWEGLVYDSDAQLLTGSFMDYAIPKADQLPSLDAFIMATDDHPSRVNELGIKGGESGTIAPAAAITNAIEDALAEFGVTVRELPVTPAWIFALLEQAGRLETEETG